MEQYDGRKIALVEDAISSHFDTLVAAQERVPDDARIPNERDHGPRIPITGPRRRDPGRPRLARAVQLRQSRGGYGVHGRW